MVRTPCCDERGLKKGTWTPEEDRKLIDYVTKHGFWNWRQLPKYAGLSRCGKSCRLRWMNYLQPNVKIGNYTEEEDDLIMKLHESLGNRWSVIAANLQGRTDNEVKNRWHTLLKHRSKQTTLIANESKPGSYDCSNHGRILGVKSESFPSFDQTFLQKLESSQSSSSSESSSTTIATNATIYGKLRVEDNVLPMEVDEETAGDFWTQPFLVDKSNMTTVETGALFPSSPIIAEDLLCFYGMFDQPIESLQW